MKTIERNGTLITFDPVLHKYTDQTGRVYTSTTTFIHKFFEDFNALEVAMKVAGNGKYAGMSIQEVIGLWEDNKNKACDFGTKCHEAIEDYLKERKPITDLEGRERSILAFLEVFENKYEFIESEKMIFSTAWGISGTVDVIFRNRETGKLLIGDWKTNKKIEKYNKFRNGLNCLSSLADCEFNKYSLQLTIYRAILQNEGYFDTEDCELALFHCKPSGVERIDVEPMEIELGYMLLESGVI